MIVLDESHLFKNEATALSKSMNRIKNQRIIYCKSAYNSSDRTPFQNNLVEYHRKVSFINQTCSEVELINIGKYQQRLYYLVLASSHQ